MSNHVSVNGRPGRCFILLAAIACGLAGVSTSALADGLKFGELELRDLAIETIVEDKIIFVNAGGFSNTRDIKEVKLIRMNQYPDLGRGEDFLAARRPGDALSSFQKARSGLKHKWLGPWIDWRIQQTYDILGQPVDSIRLYLRMARAGVHPVYLSRPPNASLIKLDEGTKAQMLSQIDSSLRSLRAGAAKTEITKLREAVNALNIAASKAALADQATQPGNSLLPTAAPTLAIKSAIPLPRSLLTDAGDDVTKLLAAGEFEKAIELADQWLSRGQTGGLYKRLYQRGTAQLHLAQKTENTELYKDAGLSLMRVVIYSKDGRYSGPAMIEAGRVQHKIGRNDLARKLYDQAIVHIDPEEDPELAERLEKLKAELTQSN